MIEGHQSGDEPFVYLLEQNGSYKIGYSSSVSKRVRSFNTAHSKPVRIIAVAPGGRNVELALHEQFQHYKIAREWFSKRIEVRVAFGQLPGAMVFLPGHITTEAPTL